MRLLKTIMRKEFEFKDIEEANFIKVCVENIYNGMKMMSDNVDEDFSYEWTKTKLYIGGVPNYIDKIEQILILDLGIYRKGKEK